ncbi:MAG: glutamate--tRNA ligase [Chloroflexi bacterium]|nr:glutamate--tRNA ligase [Chloroflexota bacterium]
MSTPSDSQPPTPNPQPPVRVRIAPSPTGDPHVGTAYTALFNVAFARHHGGQFVLRIEDTDRTRFVEQSERLIFDSLRWLGLTWDEGPDVGGPYGPYRQSERVEFYQQCARELVARGQAYSCWCTPERLKRVREEALARGEPPKYDRLCLGLAEAQRSQRPDFSPRPVIRLRMPSEGETSFEDVLRGRISFQNALIDDQVLLKSDGFPTYHLAVVVDDHLMHISHVIRGEEWISSTPKHVVLYQDFGWELPVFVHLPLLRNRDRSKVSKRRNPWAVLPWFRGQGYLPEALRNFLALMGWSMPDGREIFTLDEMVQAFSFERMSTTSPIFDLEKLDWLNGHYIRQLPLDELTARTLPFLDRAGLPASQNVAYVRDILALEQERLRELAEAPQMVDFFFADRLVYDPRLLVGKGMTPQQTLEAIKATLALVETIQPFDAPALEAAIRGLTGQLGLKTGSFFMALRVAVTGRTVSPPLFQTMAVLGRARTVACLKAACDEVAQMG